MKREDISAALSGIDEKYIEEAADLPAHRRTRSWTKGLVSLAACLAVVLSLGLYHSYLDRSMKTEEISQSDGSAPTAGALPGIQNTEEAQTQMVLVAKLRVERELENGFMATLTEPVTGYEAGTRVEVQAAEKEQEPDPYKGCAEVASVPEGALVEVEVVGFTRIQETIIFEVSRVTILEN